MDEDFTRREFLETAVVTSAVVAFPADAEERAAPERPRIAAATCSLTINRQAHEVPIDPRTTLLDLLRENLHLTGTKKGCDHGQCGACTVLVNGRRELSCLSLALAHNGDDITTIEGLADGDTLHPMQQAFLERDAFQCGYCTSGQICSAVALLKEADDGVPSVVTLDLARNGAIALSDDEIRERMAGNICRCGAYPNIVAAVRDVARSSGRIGESA